MKKRRKKLLRDLEFPSEPASLVRNGVHSRESSGMAEGPDEGGRDQKGELSGGGREWELGGKAAGDTRCEGASSHGVSSTWLKTYGGAGSPGDKDYPLNKGDVFSRRVSYNGVRIFSGRMLSGKLEN